MESKDYSIDLLKCWVTIPNASIPTGKIITRIQETHITPIFCIGEELEIRESGAHVEHVLNQVRNGLKGFHKPDLKKIVFAYEPVWAIGTGKTASAQDAQEVCQAIRSELEKIGSNEIAEAARILYGGSVKSSNIVEIMQQPDVDGVLVGGASLDPEEFARIAKFHRAVTA